MNKENAAFTGFFNNGHKRIDLVLVLGDTGSNETEELRINYLINLIKFGFELELEEGTMYEHRKLIFVKVHATDSIIEEYGLYFNERKFFKDSHIDLINPYLNFLGMKHEREVIKIVREQYPGPVNYSTLERSNIVYKIFLRLPFGQHENFFGINQLLQRNIVDDVFALHDGPYFVASSQNSTTLSARQALYYNWVGIINIWRTQPIYMIQEYLGERVAFYFAYYEYFNWMLIFPVVYGFWIAIKNYYKGRGSLNYFARHICDQQPWRVYTPTCRNFTLCPFRYMYTYCRELKFINVIDTPDTRSFACYISLWGIIFTVLWLKKTKYLAWMWEITDHIKNIVKPEYYSPKSYRRSHLTGVTVDTLLRRMLIQCLPLLLFMALFVAWLYCLFIISVYVWYIKHWLLSRNATKNPLATYYREHLYIAMGAGVYSILGTLLRMSAKRISYILTALENNKTFELYDFSLAIKLYGFSFSGTFALLTFHLLVDHFFFTHNIWDPKYWYTFAGYGAMNNGVGTSFDDICVTLAVFVIVEEIIMKLPSYLYSKRTDYLGVINMNSPCWEREYKLDVLKDDYFHNGYNAIAIQFAMATLFSSTFTLAPFLILLINIWDVRHKARNILLAYRRPLLLNISGPAIWHKIMYWTAYAIPIYNVAIIALQSVEFLIYEAFTFAGGRYRTVKHTWELLSYYNRFDGIGSPAEEIKRVNVKEEEIVFLKVHYYHYDKKFFAEDHILSTLNYRCQYLFIYSILGILMNLIVHYLIPIESSDICDAIIEERKIKENHYIQKGILPSYEE